MRLPPGAGRAVSQGVKSFLRTPQGQRVLAKVSERAISGAQRIGAEKATAGLFKLITRGIGR